jgi:hypothetical protein
MRDMPVCVYANLVPGPFSDRTAILRVVGQFDLPNVGSTALTMEYVLGQLNNRTSARFVLPTLDAIAAVRGAGAAELREGDIVQVGSAQFVVTAGGFEEWSG